MDEHTSHELAYQNGYDKGYADGKRDAVKMGKGRWQWDERFHDYTCSKCHNWDLKTPNFCSNCGADMRGEEDG